MNYWIFLPYPGFSRLNWISIESFPTRTSFHDDSPAWTGVPHNRFNSNKKWHFETRYFSTHSRLNNEGYSSNAIEHVAYRNNSYILLWQVEDSSKIQKRWRNETEISRQEPKSDVCFVRQTLCLMNVILKEWLCENTHHHPYRNVSNSRVEGLCIWCKTAFLESISSFILLGIYGNDWDYRTWLPRMVTTLHCWWIDWHHHWYSAGCLASHWWNCGRNISIGSRSWQYSTGT